MDISLTLIQILGAKTGSKRLYAVTSLSLTSISDFFFNLIQQNRYHSHYIEVPYLCANILHSSLPTASYCGGCRIQHWRHHKSTLQTDEPSRRHGRTMFPNIVDAFLHTTTDASCGRHSYKSLSSEFLGVSWHPKFHVESVLIRLEK